jgi:hypothetical protein
MIEELEDKDIVQESYIEFLDPKIDIVRPVIIADQDLWFAWIYMIQFFYGWGSLPGYDHAIIRQILRDSSPRHLRVGLIMFDTDLISMATCKSPKLE